MIRVRAATIAFCAALHLAACQAPSRPTLPEQAEPTPNPTTPAAESAVPESPASTTTATEEAFPTTPAPTISSDEVFARLVARLETPACGRGENAASWRKRYAGHPARFAERLRAILPLLAHVTLEVERAGLPGEFALIPLVESWYQPEAIGVGGPAGMWQMVAGTARGHGIAILPGYDGRLSPLHSTRAALAHLAAMHARFGDWRLAAVGYNAGEYRAQRMASHNTTVPAPGEYRRPTGRSDVIHEYIGKLKALACLLAKPARHQVRLPTGIEVERLEALTLPSGIHRLDTVAAALEMPAGELRGLNAGHRHGLIAHGAPREILVPAATRGRWKSLDGLGDSPPPTEKRIPGATHTVARGESLWTIARRYRISMKDLMHRNRLDAKSVLRPGQVLQLPP